MTHDGPLPDLLSALEIAATLPCSVRRAYRLINERQLPSVQTRLGKLVRRTDFDAFRTQWQQLPHDTMGRAVVRRKEAQG